MHPIKKLSDIKIDGSHKATLQFLNNRLKHRKPEFPAPAFFMLLGAGCSIDAQIPPGGGIISFLQKRCFAQWQLSFKDESELDIDKIDKLFNAPDTKKKLAEFVIEKQKICHANVDEKKEELLKTIPQELLEILIKENHSKDLWDVVKEEFYQTSYYSFWFDITLPSPRDRQQLIEKIIDRKDPSAAYFLLACAVRKDIFRTFFTTNFDDLINDAILQETGVKSRVYVHNEVVKFINFRSPRPNIIKLHGDYLYQDMKNTLKETSVLQDDQFYKLQEASQDMGAVIIGYSGADLSIMDALYKIKLQKGADFPLFWCAKSEDSITWKAKYLINQFENSYFVPTDSFDQLTHSIYLDLDCKIRDIKEKTDTVEKNHKNATDLITRLNKGVNIPNYLEDKKEKLEDDLSVNEIITNAQTKEKLEDRISYLNLGLTKFPENEYLYMWRGFYFNDLQKYEDAIKDYDKSIALKPDISSSYNNRGLAKDNIKLHEEAIKDYNKAIELDPANSTAYNNRGLAKENFKLYEEAIKDYDKAIEVNPKESTYYGNRGLTKDSLKLYEEAIKDFDKAIYLNPNEPSLYVSRGSTKNNLKWYDQAIKDYDKAIELNPNFISAYNNRGSTKNNLKLYDEAIKDLDKAIDLDKNYALPNRHKGVALLKLGKLEEAEMCIRKAIELDQNYSFAYATLATLYAIKGEIDFFYENFEIALQKDIDLGIYNIFEDEINKPFLKEERLQNLLKKYNKSIDP